MIRRAFMQRMATAALAGMLGWELLDRGPRVETWANAMDDAVRPKHIASPGIRVGDIIEFKSGYRARITAVDVGIITTDRPMDPHPRIGEPFSHIPVRWHASNLWVDAT